MFGGKIQIFEVIFTSQLFCHFARIFQLYIIKYPGCISVILLYKVGERSIICVFREKHVKKVISIYNIIFYMAGKMSFM